MQPEGGAISTLLQREARRKMMKKNNSRAKSKSSPSTAETKKPELTAQPEAKTEAAEATAVKDVEQAAAAKAHEDKATAVQTEQATEAKATEATETQAETAANQKAEAKAAAQSDTKNESKAEEDKNAAPGEDKAEAAKDKAAESKEAAADKAEDQAADKDAAQTDSTTEDKAPQGKAPAGARALSPKIRKSTATKKKEAKSLATTEDTPIAEAFKARIIVVTSGKGGVGKTTSAAAISTGLALKGHKTAVIDFDVGLRNLDLIMGVERRVVYDFINVIHGEAQLNQALIKDRHSDNLYILPASQTRDKDALTYHGVGKVMQELSDMGFEYIICDSPAGIEAGALIALYYADEAIVTTNPEVSSVRDSDRIIGILNARSRRAEQNLDPVTPKLLLTRYVPERVEKKEMLSTGDIQELLSIPLLGIIPESPDVLKASNAGVTIILNQESEAGQAYQDAVERLLGNDVPFRFSQAKKKGFLAKLFGGN